MSESVVPTPRSAALMASQHRRRARYACAPLALAAGLAEVLSWEALGELPRWVAAQAPDAPTSARMALWCGAVWHQPALRRCIDVAQLRDVEAVLAPGALSAVLSLPEVGRQQMMPAAPDVMTAFRDIGRQWMAAALPAPWQPLVGALWQWPDPFGSAGSVPTHPRSADHLAQASAVCEAAAQLMASFVPLDTPAGEQGSGGGPA